MYSTIDRIEYDVTGRAACFIYVRVKTRIQFALQDGDFHSTKKGFQYGIAKHLVQLVLLILYTTVQLCSDKDRGNHVIILCHVKPWSNVKLSITFDHIVKQCVW